MASLETIRKITIRGSTEGVDQATASLNKLAAAQGNVAVVSDQSAKRALSAEAAYRKQTMSLDEQARMQANVAKATKTADAALAQGIITQDEHAKRVALINTHYGQMTRQQAAVGAAMSELNGRLAAATGSAGSLGSVLMTLGPVGIGVAAVLGGVVLALNAMSNAAHGLAEKAQELRRFSEVTGLTTAQVQALRSEASKFGVTSDEAQTAIQNFTARFNELRLGQGELLTQIRRVNPALADQMQMTTNAGDALTLFGAALAKVDDIFQRNALVKAATGRGGLTAAAFLSNLNVDKVTQSFVDAGKGLDKNLIGKLSQLEIDIQKTSSAAKQNISSIFAEPVLQAELKFAQNFLEFSRTVKSFAMSEDLRKLVDKAEMVWRVITALPRAAYSAGYSAAGGPEAPAAPKGDRVPTSFADRFQPAIDRPFGQLSVTTSKTLEAQVADLKKLIEVLGPAATEAEKLSLRQKELALTARDAGVSAGVLGRAQAALNAEFALNRLRETVGALGAAATAAEQYGLRQDELAEKVRAGQISQETATRALADYRKEQELSFTQANLAAYGSSATAAEQYAARVQELQLQLERGKISQEAFNRGIAAANPLMNQLKDISKEFLTTAAQGFLNAKAGTDSLSKSFEALSLRLADKALEQFMSGDWEKAAVTAIMAVVAAVISLVSHTNDLKGTIEVLDRLNQLRLRQVRANADTGTLAGQLAVFNANAILEQIEEARKGGALMGALIQVQNEERLQIERDFQKQAADIEKQAAEQRLARQQSLEDRIFAATNDTSTLEGALAAQQRDFAKERLEEEKNGNLDVAKLLQAQQAEELALRKSFNDKVIEETQRAEQERLDALNQSARSIVDYLTGLTSGPGSTLSPMAILTNAQAAYNANLGLAQSGNIDAQNKFVSLADNLEKAARAVYASGQGYQDIRNQILTQGLTLPAVQATTDPVVQALRDTITEIQVRGLATVDAIATMQSTLATAMNSGNPAAVALALSNYFSTLDANVSGLIDFNEMKSALGGMASDAALRDMFTRLDTDQSGNLDKAELIRTATKATQDNTAAALVKLTDAIVTLTAAKDEEFWHSNQFGAMQGILHNIQDLNSTAADQLRLLREQLTIAGGQAGASLAKNQNAPGVGDIANVSAIVSSNNNLLTALNKIVVNTYAISFNTAVANDIAFGLSGGQRGSWIVGAKAMGGWINGPGGPHDDRAGLYALSNREFVVNADATRALTSMFGSGVMDTINAGRVPVMPVHSFAGANDNSALLARIDRLTAELRALRAERAGDGALTRQTIERNGDKVAGKVDDQTDALAAQERQSNRQRKVA